MHSLHDYDDDVAVPSKLVLLNFKTKKKEELIHFSIQNHLELGQLDFMIHALFGNYFGFYLKKIS